MIRMKPFKRISLTPKITIISLLAGSLIWLALDQLVAKAITQTFQDQLNTHLQQESLSYRIRFSKHINSFKKAVKLYASQATLAAHLDHTGWEREDPVALRVHRQPPPWFVDSSTLRSFVAPRFAILYDPWNVAREVYLNEGTTLPQPLVNPSAHLLHVSQGESYLTPIDGTPYLITSHSVPGQDGSNRATLLIGSPLDTELLLSSQGGLTEGITVALISGDRNRVIVSTDPEELPLGTSLADLSEGHLSTGQEFFEYGSSEVNFKFASLTTTAEMNRLSRSFAAKVRNYRAVMASVYVLTLVFLITRVTRRISKLTERVNDYSLKTLGGDPMPWIEGDQIDHLDQRFQRLTTEVERSHRGIEKEMTERALQKEKLRSFERQIELLSSVTETMGVGIIVVSDTEETPGNKKMVSILETVSDLSLFLTGSKEAQVRTVIDNKGEERIFHLVNLRLPSDENVVLVRDITENRRAEEERKTLGERLVQSQKMESIGRLAGGVAHDFNNILSAIMGFAELTRLKMDNDDPLRPNMDQIVSAGAKAADLTEQLLAFSRKQIIKPEPIYLSLLLEEMQAIIRRLIESDVNLSIEKGVELWPIMADPLQINQILINLIVNSRDAMPVGGKITIRTDNVTVGGKSLTDRPGLTPGEYVLLSLSDTGIGIPDQVLEHIFEPFFTTKDVGKGTGLGLATVYGIVKQSEGHISVHSEPGEGTTFEILFPRSLESAPAEDSLAVTSFPGGRETILVAEDEKQVRSLVIEVLNELGYKTLEAGDGAEAAELLVEHCDSIDLILSDIIMPGMSGRALADRAHDVCPNIGVLFMSGYTDDDILKYGIARDEVRFLQKPVTPSKIAQAVRETLDEYWTRRKSTAIRKS